MEKLEQNIDLDSLTQACLTSGILVEKVTPILGKGTVNRVYIVESNTGERAIIRLNKADELHVFEKEVWSISNARMVGTRTPKSIASGVIADSSYMIQEYISGIDGTDHNDPIAVWHDIGVNARLIHSVPTTGFGDRMDQEGNFTGSWEQYIDYDISSLTDKDPLVMEHIITPAQSSSMKSIFQGLKSKTFNFGLQHGDLSLKNSVIQSDGTNWIIDWGCACAHITPHYDFIEILENNIHRNSEEFNSFLKGYGYGVSDFDAIASDVYGLMLLRAIDKVRWARDRRPDLVDEKVVALRKVLVLVKENNLI